MTPVIPGSSLGKQAKIKATEDDPTPAIITPIHQAPTHRGSSGVIVTLEHTILTMFDPTAGELHLKNTLCISGQHMYHPNAQF